MLNIVRLLPYQGCEMMKKRQEGLDFQVDAIDVGIRMTTSR
jgi:hypothetical protein